MTPPAAPLLLVTVGTDHHPFDRLVRWVDGWLDGETGQAAGLRCLMQTGTSAPPGGSGGPPGWSPGASGGSGGPPGWSPGASGGSGGPQGGPPVNRPGHTAQWQAYLEFDALQAAMRDAAAVVCHGGPGTILGARHVGAVPIVVPRRHRLGEHVDDHQLAFCRRLAADGGVFLAETEAELHELLDRVAAEPAAFRAAAEHRGTATAVRAFERLVDDLVAGRPAAHGGLAPEEVPR